MRCKHTINNWTTQDFFNISFIAQKNREDKLIPSLQKTNEKKLNVTKF